MRRLLRVLLALAVLAAGVGVLALLVRTKPAPEKKPVVDRGLLVRTEVAKKSDHRLVVEAQGTVLPAREIVLQPEVSGRVVWQSPELVPGGRFKKGQTVLRIDASDYQLAVKQQEANVDRAKLELRLEKSRQAIGKDEWAILSERGEGTEEGKALVLREPQIETARTNIESAESARRRAVLAVSKTVLVAPFNALVQAESVDVGQLVSPQSTLARLVGTDAFWVQVSVPVSQLGVLAVPGFNAPAGAGSEAEVVQDVGSGTVKRTGRVIRLYGDLDPMGKMARVLVEIEDPLGLQRTGEKPADGASPVQNGLPLLVGAYVDVAIQGRATSGVFEVPRVALRDGDRVYLYGKEDRLEVRDVHVVWRRDESVLVDRGLGEGDAIIVSRVASAVAGAKLRRAPPEDKPTAAKAP